VIKGVAPEVDLEMVFNGILPFFLVMVASVVILILFPKIALLLPGLR
jgi:TRAP-type C4-dicarboxylate transport system permease large subunit